MKDDGRPALVLDSNPSTALLADRDHTIIYCTQPSGSKHYNSYWDTLVNLSHSGSSSMPDRNKKRVFVALYFRQSITSDPNSQALGPARFHWAIWIEPKRSKGEGACYQVLSQPAYRNVPGSGGWTYNYRPTADYNRSNSMMVRIMIGKLPKGIGYGDVHAVLQQVRLPRENSRSLENCVTWTKAAVEQLQRRRCVESFSISRFVDHAQQRASRLYVTREWQDKKLKENYTRRKFP